MLSLGHVFGSCLVAGFAYSLLLFLSAGRVVRLPGHHHLRLPRLLRLRRRMAPGQPWAGPLVVGMFLTVFGASGLMLSVQLALPSALALGGAAATGVLLSAAAVRAFGRLLADGGSELRGATLLGSVCRVSLAIPEGGVGSIASTQSGKRSVIPARAKSGRALPPGQRVLILGFEDRVALVEEL